MSAEVSGSLEFRNQLHSILRLLLSLLWSLQCIRILPTLQPSSPHPRAPAGHALRSGVRIQPYGHCEFPLCMLRVTGSPLKGMRVMFRRSARVAPLSWSSKPLWRFFRHFCSLLRFSERLIHVFLTCLSPVGEVKEKTHSPWQCTDAGISHRQYLCVGSSCMFAV